MTGAFLFASKRLRTSSVSGPAQGTTGFLGLCGARRAALPASRDPAESTPSLAPARSGSCIVLRASVANWAPAG